MAESQLVLFKTELIKKRRPWRSVEHVELATLEWAWWFNNQRLHSELDYCTPAEVEAEYYAENTPVATAIHGKPRNKTQGDSTLRNYPKRVLLMCHLLVIPCEAHRLDSKP